MKYGNFTNSNYLCSRLTSNIGRGLHLVFVVSFILKHLFLTYNYFFPSLFSINNIQVNINWNNSKCVDLLLNIIAYAFLENLNVQ